MAYSTAQLPFTSTGKSKEEGISACRDGRTDRVGDSQRQHTGYGHSGEGNSVVGGNHVWGLQVEQLLHTLILLCRAHRIILDKREL